MKLFNFYTCNSNYNLWKQIKINKNQKNAINFITNKYFLISFIVKIIFSYYVMFVLYENDVEGDEKDLKNEWVKIDTKDAVIAYVIAIFTHIDSTIWLHFY
jgi:energy-converting hydrogenase Eha subunit H